jgi:AcrR family transcriptional regulator
MSARLAAAAVTRDRIVEVAARAFNDSWYDDVTIRGIAAASGVATQTVLNNFPTKEALYAAAAEWTAERIQQARFDVEPGDVHRAIAVLMDDYEEKGDSYLRTLAMEGRLTVVEPTLAIGRAGHERWCEHVFGPHLAALRGTVRARRLAQLVIATDVYAWKLLRRDRGMSKDETRKTIRELVVAVLAS